ncbi:MAG TPA: ribosome maturation factor RimM [Spirochaetia bacterium]|nr:ribosome maturation factor RimM [Spirochaetia bacterium]
MSADMLAVGVVTATHGLAGEVRSTNFSGESAHFLALREAVFRNGKGERALRIETARPHPRGVLLKIAGIDTLEQARALIGSEIWVPRERASRLKDGEYYTADLCACRLWFGNELIGDVRSVWEGGSAQLLEVTAPSGKTFLVPFTDHFIGEVDIAGGRIVLKEDEIVR